MGMTMMRSSFFATGLFVLMWGASFLVVDKVVLHAREEAPQKYTGFRGMFTTTNASRQRVFDPPDWAAFSLLSIGSVTMLYAIALPGKKKEHH
jgi:hypothetical protein